MQLNQRPLDLINHLGAELKLRAPPNGAAMLCFTSGTTAAPKAAVLSHTAFHVQSMSKLLNIGYCSEDVYYHAAPLCHIGKPTTISFSDQSCAGLGHEVMWKDLLGAGGLSSAFAVLMAGAFHVFPGRFEAVQMKRDMQQHNVRWNSPATEKCRFKF